MGFFSFSKKPETVYIRTEVDADPDDDNQLVSDIVDLRAIKKKPSFRHSPTHPKKERHHKDDDDAFYDRLRHDRVEEDSDSTFADAARKFFAKQVPVNEPKSPHIVSRYFQDHQWYRSKGFLYGVGAVAVLAGGGVLLSTTFANATLVIVPKQSSIPFSRVALKVDPSLTKPDQTAKKIPGELIQYSDDVSMSFPSTGQKYVQSKARGTITIFNRLSSSPQSLVASTRFQDTKTGKILRITKGVTIPGAKIENGEIQATSVDAEVEADKAGEEYNLSEGQFTIPGFAGTPKFKGFSATLAAPMTGGFIGQTKVVTKDDLAKASDEFQKQSTANLESRGTGKIPQGFIVISSAQKIDILSKNFARVGDPGESFTLKGKVRFTNIAFEKNTLLNFLNNTVSATSSYKIEIISDKSTVSYDSLSLSNDGKLDIVASGVLITNAVIEPLMIQSSVHGVSLDAAKSILQGMSFIENFGIKVFPFWKRTLPEDAAKITIQTIERK